MLLLLGLVVIAAAVVAVIRNVDVRLTLLLAALVLGVLAGDTGSIARKFFSTLAAEEFLIPICTAMGFAQVLRHTQCDRHLVHLLVGPLRRAKALLVPGAILVGFVVNIPIISQTSTAAAVGAVLIPLLLAAGVRPVTAGAVLLLGTSIGGALLNQGAPEFRTIVRETAGLGLAAPSGAQCVQAVLPLVALHLAVSTVAFWWMTRRQDAQAAGPATGTAPPETPEPPLRVSYAKAAVPLVPLALLFLVAPPLKLIEVPRAWLVGPADSAPFDSRLVGVAMVVGVAVAAVVARRAVIGPFFEGTGYAVTHIISIIVAAACFGEGVKLLGLHKPVAGLLVAIPQLLVPVGGLIPLGFGFISGSGMAATQALFGLFAGPSLSLGVAPEHMGAVVALGAAAGRTMSPVAAVALMCASLTQTRSADLVRRVAGPLLAGIIAVALAASLIPQRTTATAAQGQGLRGEQQLAKGAQPPGNGQD